MEDNRTVKYELEVGNSDGKPCIISEKGNLESEIMRKIAFNAIIKGRYNKVHIITYEEGGLLEEYTK